MSLGLWLLLNDFDVSSQEYHVVLYGVNSDIERFQLKVLEKLVDYLMFQMT